jgi:hypothetical protein
MGITSLSQFSASSKNFFVANQKPLETAAIVVGVTVVLAAATVLCPADAPVTAAAEDGLITGAVAGDAFGGVGVEGTEFGLEGGLGSTEAGPESSNFFSIGSRSSFDPNDFATDAERMSSNVGSNDPFAIASGPTRAFNPATFGFATAEDEIGANGLGYSTSTLETAAEDSSFARSTMEGSLFSIRSSLFDAPELGGDAELTADFQAAIDDNPAWSTMGDDFDEVASRGLIPQDQLVVATLRNAGLDSALDNPIDGILVRMEINGALETGLKVGGILGTALAAGGINMILQQKFGIP